MRSLLSFGFLAIVLGLLATTDGFTVQVPPDAPTAPPLVGRPTVQAERVTPGHRWISVPHGATIESQLLPSDRVVELRIVAAPPLVGDEVPERDELDYWTRRADVAAVVRVEERTSRLAINGSWIVTDVRARVQDSLKDIAGGRGAPGAIVTFTETGGDLMINGVRVIASLSRAMPSGVGREYLMFFRLREAALVRLSRMAVFEADNGTFSRFIPPNEPFAKTSFDRVKALAAVRAAVGGVQ
jgi:hypothetical protein